jgi:uncharacterized protein YggT (Ycf19 family)
MLDASISHMRTITIDHDHDHVAARLTATARIGRVLDYLFGVLYAILGLRLALAFIDARHTAGFTQFVDRITNPFYEPFRGIVASDRYAGQLVVWPLVIAIVVYVILHALIRGLLRVIARA